MELCGVPANLLTTLRSAAAEAGSIRIALVGGIVRDSLLHHSCREPRGNPVDIDLVVEGSAAMLARVLQQRLKIPTSPRLHPSYDTAGLILDGKPLDIATARTEIYPAPGYNPVITPGSLESDLARRDFSVNAIALDLGSGRLVDPHHGCEALARRELEFLHSHSVADDPTRIVRAARYAARLGFRLALSSYSQLSSTINSWPWPWRQGDLPTTAPPALGVRLRMELELLFKHEPRTIALQLLQQWGALELLDPGLQRESDWQRRLRCARWLGVDPLLGYIIAADKPLALASRLQLPIRQQRLLTEALLVRHRLTSSQMQAELHGWRPSQWCYFLENSGSLPAAIALCACLNLRWTPTLRRWFWRWRLCKSPESSHQLIVQGWVPGAELGAELQRRRLAALDREED
ncbi:CCA tRNA nucleotidyltransferase [cyanobiont of Ornithocercus magnificus]|nr:CCA tRNA nucleotidyltransferase [cyanobiont of Ornithocercus magnificus]